MNQITYIDSIFTWTFRPPGYGLITYSNMDHLMCDLAINHNNLRYCVITYLKKLGICSWILVSHTFKWEKRVCLWILDSQRRNSWDIFEFRIKWSENYPEVFWRSSPQWTKNWLAFTRVQDYTKGIMSQNRAKGISCNYLVLVYPFVFSIYA